MRESRPDEQSAPDADDASAPANGGPPAPPGPRCRPVAVAELDDAALSAALRADQCWRWQRGDRVRVEAYLERLPALHDREPVVLDLIAQELLLREQQDESPDPDEYLRRFARYRPQLQRQFQLPPTPGREHATCRSPDPVREPAGLQVVDDGRALLFAPTGHWANVPPRPSPAPTPADGKGRPTRDVRDGEPAAPRGPLGADAPRAFGRYRVRAWLGSGGFGVVYEGYDEELQREVAIKVPRPDHAASDADFSAYLDEARNLARLDHPRIVPVYDVGRTEDGRCYLVSKLVHGIDLARRLRQGRPSPAEAAALVASVAEALHSAHQRGLVHRDIKPGNILLDRDGQPVVVDFGTALREEDLGTGPDYVGTPAYMSPEQARGEGHLVDARTDVYSLGVVLYELLTGQEPFRAADSATLLEQVRTREPRPPRQYDPALPRELDRICLKALAKRASDRYSTALDLAEDLRHWQAAGPLTPAHAPAAPPSSGPAEAPESAATREDSQRALAQVVPKGLRSFDAEDADFFLGLLPGPRDRDGLPDSVRFWKTRLEEADPDRTFRVGLLYGPSGCGKSSLVKAGLLPRLARHVVPVYVEAAAGDTEARLLRGLRRQCPDLPAGSDLVEALAGLRRGQGLPEGRKVVLVLDQFEQWLHAWREGPDTALVRALRQCDGRRVQCLLLVRDDYWMTLTRFLRELEVPLLEGRNSAAVDLLDARHAHKVLAAFGRAFGALPEGEPAPEQDRFLDRVVAELGHDGKVVPVRLSLFAEMVKTKRWTPGTLKEVGGAAGVGVSFLEETFSARTAPPEHRRHQAAARAVLQALLPPEGADLKGQMQPYQALLRASGYGPAAGEFDALLRILDMELRLITPTDREGAAPAGPGEAYYQLSHDYLVHALRQWLTAKQRETFRGRAELRLAEWADLWGRKPGPRTLPPWGDWLRILLLVPRGRWSAAERRLMAAATRRYAARGLVAAAILLLAVLAGFGVRGHFREERRAAQAEGLVSRLLDADIAQVPAIIDALAGFRAWTDPQLARVVNDPDRPPPERLRASLALLPGDEAQVAYLLDRLPRAEPDELLVICRQLQPRSASLVGPLWEALKDGSHGPAEKLRIAGALAAYDPDNPAWSDAAGPLVGQLVKENLLHLRQWLAAFRPVRKPLLAPLGAIFRAPAHDPAERAVAVSILVDYARDEPDFLIELVKDAEPRQYEVVLGPLRPFHDQVVAAMNEELSRRLPRGASEAEKERRARRQVNAAVTLYRAGEFEPVWPLFRHAPDPRVRHELIHQLPLLSADPLPLVRRWDAEADVSARRGLLLALGGFGDRLPAAARGPFTDNLLDAFRADPDPGVHAAAEWLLNQWGAGDRLREATNALAGHVEEGRPWSVTGEGHTLVRLDPRGAPRSLSRGKPIGHCFAIAAREVSVAQFLRHNPAHNYNRKFSPEPDCPVNMVTWFAAAAYCRWLSEQEGVPEDQMCFPPLPEIREGMQLPPDYLVRTGYRLPTDAEWEYACRAGAVTVRPFGPADTLVPWYAWHNKNAGQRLWPGGRLRPNDFGLYDMLGNALEWCQESAAQAERGGEDREDPRPVTSELVRVLRGGSVNYTADKLSSEQRDSGLPRLVWNSIGFRVARTCPPHP